MGRKGLRCEEERDEDGTAKLHFFLQVFSCCVAIHVALVRIVFGCWKVDRNLETIYSSRFCILPDAPCVLILTSILTLVFTISLFMSVGNVMELSHVVWTQKQTYVPHFSTSHTKTYDGKT